MSINSPFPGMDPYLEQYWGDVHAALVTYCRDAIQPRLPADLRARMRERLVVTNPEEAPRDIVPDVRVVERSRGPSRGGTAVLEIEEIAVAEPLILRVDEPAAERFIEIAEAKSPDRVITVIEVLSLSNKRSGPERAKYLRKREELANAGISLVEIDLIRGGVRELGNAFLTIPESHRTTYGVCVHRGDRPIEYEVYRAPIRERLPKIRIPLRPSDADCPLDLQAVVDQCYRNGRYDQTDYAIEPTPPFDPEDAPWANALLREKKLR